MAIIKELELRRINQGQYSEHYFQTNLLVSSGVGNESDVIRITLLNKVNIQFTNGSLYESLDKEEDIINDTAHFELVATSAEDSFVYTAGVSYLKVINDGVGDSIFSVTGA